MRPTRSAVARTTAITQQDTAPAPLTSTLLSLSPELLDHILSYVAPHSTPRTRKLLVQLLRVSPTLNPLIRRRLYRSISYIIGTTTAKANRRSAKLLTLLSTGVAAPFVRTLAFRLPDPTQVSAKDLETHGAIAGVIADEKWSQAKAMAVAGETLSYCKGTLKLEVEVRIATREDGRTEEPEEGAARESFKECLLQVKGVEYFSLSVPTRNQVCQVLATPDFSSPWMSALAIWSNLSTVELWRVRLHLPAVFTAPPFRLQTLILNQCELNSSSDVLFFLENTTSLKSLTITYTDFLSSPEFSDPLLDVFVPTTATSFHEPFAPALMHLKLRFSNPFSPSESDRASVFFTRLTSLQILTLGGAGITPLVLTSLPSLNQVHSLYLAYVPSLPLKSFLNIVTPSKVLPRLRALEYTSRTSHPRSLTFEEQSAIDLPYAPWEGEGWLAVIKWAKSRHGRNGVDFKLLNDKVSIDFDDEDDEGDDDEDGFTTDGDVGNLEESEGEFVPTNVEEDEAWYGIALQSGDESDF